MRKYIPKKVKLEVVKRAGSKCEYCKFHQDNSFFPFHVEHVIAIKHGGANLLENLAFSCPHCNTYKGTDLATVLDNDDKIVPLFNPRKDKWNNHFITKEGKIIGKTNKAKGTIKLLRLNEPERVIIRKILEESGHYP